ncbi:MAG: hypothetical protein K2P63_11080 [Lachnospiraceae bacterium]|nr:hypothetical protein [Lachnospiraceae bacterium]
MAMEINGSYSHTQTYWANKPGEDQVRRTEEVKCGQNGENEPGKIPAQDEYIRSEKTGMRPSGLYRLGEDENGSPKIFFDDPRRADAAKVSGEEKGGAAPGCRGKDADQPAETCTGNTDRVDREIEKLKEEKKQLELQIQSASGDEKKVCQLEQRLAQVESELSQKDNETYRRQNTVFS